MALFADISRAITLGFVLPSEWILEQKTYIERIRDEATKTFARHRLFLAVISAYIRRDKGLFNRHDLRWDYVPTSEKNVDFYAMDSFGVDPDDVQVTRTVVAPEAVYTTNFCNRVTYTFTLGLQRLPVTYTLAFLKKSVAIISEARHGAIRKDLPSSLLPYFNARSAFTRASNDVISELLGNSPLTRLFPNNKPELVSGFSPLNPYLIIDNQLQDLKEIIDDWLPRRAGEGGLANVLQRAIGGRRVAVEPEEVSVDYDNDWDDEPKPKQSVLNEQDQELYNVLQDEQEHLIEELRIAVDDGIITTEEAGVIAQRAVEKMEVAAAETFMIQDLAATVRKSGVLANHILELQPESFQEKSRLEQQAKVLETRLEDSLSKIAAMPATEQTLRLSQQAADAQNIVNSNTSLLASQANGNERESQRIMGGILTKIGDYQNKLRIDATRSEMEEQAKGQQLAALEERLADKVAEGQESMLVLQSRIEMATTPLRIQELEKQLEQVQIQLEQERTARAAVSIQLAQNNVIQTVRHVGEAWVLQNPIINKPKKFTKKEEAKRAKKGGYGWMTPELLRQQGMSTPFANYLIRLVTDEPSVEQTSMAPVPSKQSLRSSKQALPSMILKTSIPPPL